MNNSQTTTDNPVVAKTPDSTTKIPVIAADSIVDAACSSDIAAADLPIPWRCPDIVKALKYTEDAKQNFCYCCFCDDPLKKSDSDTNLQKINKVADYLSSGITPDNDVIFTSVSTDSRKITKNDLFVALKGENFDGHTFVFDLMRRGISGFVVEKEFYDAITPEDQKEIIKSSALLFIVNDTLTALGMLARFQRVRSNVKVVAITGSNGKTTTRKMTASIFEQNFNTLSTEGNLNNEIGLPLTLLKLSEKHEWAVVEMGMNHPGEISRLSKIASPDIAIVTNTTDAHLEGLGSIDDVARAKSEIIDGMNPGSVLILNMNDQRWKIIADRAKSFPNISSTVLVGSERYHDPGESARTGKEKSHFWTTDVIFDSQSITFTVQGNISFLYVKHDPCNCLPITGTTKRDLPAIKDDSLTWDSLEDLCIQNLKIRTPAPFMLHNALAATAVALVAKIPGTKIRQGLLAFEPVAGRMKIMRLGGNKDSGKDSSKPRLYLIDDTYNANPGSVKGALETLSQLSHGQESIAILGDMLELGAQSRQLHFQVGQAASAAGISRLYVYGDMVSELVAGALSAGFSKEMILHGTKDEIVSRLVEYIEKGEKQQKDIWILVKGSRGMKMETIVHFLIKLKN